MNGSGPLERLKRLRESVLAAASGARQGDDPQLAAYLDTVAHSAYRVTDDDVAALLAAGRSEDELFERTVATALGAAIERFEAGMRALDDAERSGS